MSLQEEWRTVGWVKKSEAIKLEGELVAEWLAFVGSKGQLKGKGSFLVCSPHDVCLLWLISNLLAWFASVMMSEDLCSLSH